MKKFILLLGGILLTQYSYSQLTINPPFTIAEVLEMSSNNNYEFIHNRSVRIDFTEIDKNLQGEIKDELSALGEHFLVIELDESLNELRLRWKKEFTLKELIEILEHFEISDTTIIQPWQ